MKRLKKVRPRASWTASAVVALGSAGLTAQRRGAGPAVLVASAVVGTHLADYMLAAIRREAEVRRARSRLDAERLRQMVSTAVVGTAHDPLHVINSALNAQGIKGPPREELERTFAQLRTAAAAASEASGLAAHYERDGGPMALFGTEENVRWAPAPLRRPLMQAGQLLDEVRLLHGADIEYAALLYTLTSRAIILIVSPALGRWSAVQAPLSGELNAADLVWGVCTAWSSAVALAGPQVAELTMDRGEAGARARRWLLRMEVPLALTCATTRPTWTTVIFATGWTNFWQRPGPNFYPRRLVVFITAMVAAQSAGLARAAVPILPAIAETVASWTVIGITGDSYGAMLPISAMTLVRVMVTEHSRSARAVERGGDILGDAAQQVFKLADLLVAEGQDARLIATLQEQARRLLGERPPSSTVLQILIREAGAEAEPFLQVRSATFSSQELRNAVIRDQAVADGLTAALQRCYAEAISHGQGRVYTDLTLRAGRVEVCTQNEIDPTSAPGGGQGRQLLVDLVQTGLPDGRADQPGAVVQEGARSGMWTVLFSFSAAGLAI